MLKVKIYALLIFSAGCVLSVAASVLRELVDVFVFDEIAHKALFYITAAALVYIVADLKDNRKCF